MEPARRTAGAGHDVSAGSVAIGDGAAIGRVPRCMSAGSQKMRVAARHGHGIDAAAGFGGVVCQGGAVGREGRLGVVVAGAGEAHRAAAADGLHVEFEIAAGVAVGGVGDHSTVGGDGGPTSESGIESELREEKIVGRRGLGETPERHRQNGKYDSGDDAPITHVPVHTYGTYYNCCYKLWGRLQPSPEGTPDFSPPMPRDTQSTA